MKVDHRTCIFAGFLSPISRSTTLSTFVEGCQNSIFTPASSHSSTTMPSISNHSTSSQKMPERFGNSSSFKTGKSPSACIFPPTVKQRYNKSNKTAFHSPIFPYRSITYSEVSCSDHQHATSKTQKHSNHPQPYCCALSPESSSTTPTHEAAGCSPRTSSLVSTAARRRADTVLDDDGGLLLSPDSPFPCSGAGAELMISWVFRARRDCRVRRRGQSLSLGLGEPR